MLSSFPRQLHNHSYRSSRSPSNQHEGRLGQQPTSEPNDSGTQSSYVSLTTLLGQSSAIPLQLVGREDASLMRGETETGPVAFDTGPG